MTGNVQIDRDHVQPLDRDGSTEVPVERDERQWLRGGGLGPVLAFA